MQGEHYKMLLSCLCACIYQTALREEGKHLAFVSAKVGHAATWEAMLNLPEFTLFSWLW